MRNRLFLALTSSLILIGTPHASADEAPGDENVTFSSDTASVAPADAGISVTGLSYPRRIVGDTIDVWSQAVNAPSTSAWTEVMVGSNWSRSQTRTTDATGHYRIPLTYGATTTGRYQYRVGVQTPAGPTYTSTMTLDRIPDTSVTTAGAKPVNQTTYAWGTAAGAPNTTVWTEVWDGSRWSRSQTTTTDSSGYYSIPLTYGQNTAGRYAYRVVVSTPAGGAPSLTAVIERTATITATAASSRRIGANAYAWGTVGGVPNAVVSIDVWTGSSWVRSQSSVTTDSSGKYVIPLEAGKSELGTHYYRVVVETPVGQAFSETLEQLTIP